MASGLATLLLQRCIRSPSRYQIVAWTCLNHSTPYPITSCYKTFSSFTSPQQQKDGFRLTLEAKEAMWNSATKNPNTDDWSRVYLKSLFTYIYLRKTPTPPRGIYSTSYADVCTIYTPQRLYWREERQPENLAPESHRNQQLSPSKSLTTRTS